MLDFFFGFLGKSLENFWCPFFIVFFLQKTLRFCTFNQPLKALTPDHVLSGGRGRIPLRILEPAGTLRKLVQVCLYHKARLQLHGVSHNEAIVKKISILRWKFSFAVWYLTKGKPFNIRVPKGLHSLLVYIRWTLKVFPLIAIFFVIFVLSEKRVVVCLPHYNKFSAQKIRSTKDTPKLSNQLWWGMEQEK